MKTNDAKLSVILFAVVFERSEAINSVQRPSSSPETFTKKSVTKTSITTSKLKTQSQKNFNCIHSHRIAGFDQREQQQREQKSSLDRLSLIVESISSQEGAGNNGDLTPSSHGEGPAIDEGGGGHKQPSHSPQDGCSDDGHEGDSDGGDSDGSCV